MSIKVEARSYVPLSLQSLGLGPYLDDPYVYEIIVVPGGRLFVDRNGCLEEVTLSDGPISEESVVSVVEIIASSVGDSINRDKPTLDARLPDGSRVSAIIPPASPLGTSLCIRKFPRNFTIQDLISAGAITNAVVDRVVKAIDHRENVVFSGTTSSGKTTMMNAHIALIPSDERLLVIERPVELHIDTHPATTRLESVPAIGNHPEISVESLLAASLRQRPDRIIIGEVRDSIAYDMLQAMNTGHSGTFCSVHADSAEQALYRIANLARKGYGDLRLARQEVAAAIRVVIQMSRDRSGRRAVREVIEVSPNYNEAESKFEFQTIYQR